ncbi:hypothetical protein [Acinetobacter sp. ACNIH2]|uniref:hypothetical protein n=1 Tax=Acinetobacter sp. ACNIH2 TaxID=1758189 RepID=UPI0013159A05|nr:hypothetical protein [Acinetobacter sp. ACNIH2]
MESLTSISTIIAIIVAIFSIPKSLHAVNEHRRKKFKDELENFGEYFEKFYKAETDKYPQLLKDKAAQNLTRSIDMNDELLHCLIDFHEKGLVNFDKTTDLYYWGSRFINVIKVDNTFAFTPRNRVSGAISKTYYVIYALCLTFAIIVFTGKFHFWNIAWLDVLIGVSFIIFSISSLRKADDMKEALEFLRTMNDAQSKLKSEKK